MKRFLALAAVCLSVAALSMAQTLTKEELSATMARATDLYDADKYNDALEAFLLVGKNTERQTTEEERQTYVASQTKAAECLYRTNRYEEGYLLGKKLIACKLTDIEKKDAHTVFVDNGYSLAQSLTDGDENGTRHYARAREVFQEILPYSGEEMKGNILPSISLSWFGEGIDHLRSLRYADALACYENARKGFHELDMPKFETAVLKAIIDSRRFSFDFAGSVQACHEALSIARRHNLDNDQMIVLSRLRNLSAELGDAEQAAAYTHSIDSLVETTADEQARLNYYIEKGNAAEGQGNHDMAARWFLKAKDIAESQDSTQINSNKHTVYSRLYYSYAKAERFEEALHYGKEFLSEHHKLYPPSHPNHNRPYMLIADIYSRMGDRKRCFECVDSAFIDEPRLQEPQERFWLYSHRASRFSSFKEWASALADYKKADEILATKYPETEGNRVQLQTLMAQTEKHLGHHAEAERHYKAAAEHSMQLYGGKSLDYVTALIKFACSEAYAGHIEEGCKDYTAAIGILKELVKYRLPYLNAAERESFWKPLSSSFTDMTPYALDAKFLQTEFTKTSYDALLLSKAFLLETERSLYEIVKRDGSADDMRDYMAIAALKAKTKSWEKNRQQFADSLLAASQRVSQLESALTKRCKAYGDMTSFMDIDYDAVKRSLGEGDALIDFTDFVSETAGRRYAAYIVNRRQEYPCLTALFAERQIDSLGIVRPDMYYDKDYAPDVLRLLWQPLKDFVKEGATVYYVPSQLLFQISLESLPLEDGSLLGDHYNFVRLSSAREVVRHSGAAFSAECRVQSAEFPFFGWGSGPLPRGPARPLPAHPRSPPPKKYKTVHSALQAVLYGGLQYDLTPDVMAQEAQRYALPPMLAMRGDMARGDSLFRELPGSKEEVEKIAGMLGKSKFSVTSYTGMSGTEESFLSMHGRSPKILHLATHGFYYTPDRAAAIDYLKGYTDAMSLSGLVLSGGNAAWLGHELPEGVLGGILTAANIARLDLSNTDMVALSACQTGQGRATAEGLYGLQRAFKKAGAGTMVMALWSVSDRVATDFMTTFYERLTAPENGFDKRRAFSEAKTIIRKRYPEPFYWASFVMLD